MFIIHPARQLFFSKKARPVNYEPCSLKAYKAEKPSTVWGKGKGELGKLQPDLENEELVAKVSVRDGVERCS